MGPDFGMGRWFGLAMSVFLLVRIGRKVIDYRRMRARKLILEAQAAERAQAKAKAP